MRVNTDKNLPLSIFVAFAYYNKISNAFKVNVPVFLLWRDGAAFLAFHFNPYTPGWNVKVWHAFAHAFGLQSPRYTRRPRATIGY